jgi:capsular polysaccharide biosynthesis protein
MDNNNGDVPSAITPSNALDIIRKMHADMVRHEQVLQQVMEFLQQLNQPPNEQLAPLPAWAPSPTAGMINFSPKVQHVGKPHDGSDATVTRIKAMWIGRFYARNLKQHPFVRRWANRLWRIIHIFYVRHIAVHLRNREAKRWRRLTKLGEFAKASGSPTVEIVDAAFVRTPIPRVFPETHRDYLVSPHDKYLSPRIYVATINGGIVYGGTNLALSQDEVICHDLYEFTRDRTSEELHGRSVIDPGTNRIRWMAHDESPEYLQSAAAFVDACAPNYAHWLTEVLPRIAMFCGAHQFRGIPLVVNDGLHHNIMESLYLVAGAEREIITLPLERAITVDALYLTSVAGYVPFERRDTNIAGHSHGIFSPHAFELVRKQVLTAAEKLPKQAWPDKIYLRRNSGVRKVTNGAVLERLLSDHGYAIVEPEKLTFLQQAELFHHARVIIGSSGAALANIIFCSPNTRLIVLISKHPSTSYWYWQNIACASGTTVQYVLGEAAEDVNGIHADFAISVDDLLPLVVEETS